MNSEAAGRCFHTTRWSVVRRVVMTPKRNRRFPRSAQPIGTRSTRIFDARERISLMRKISRRASLRVLEKETFVAADPSRGKLRTFLLICAGNFMKDDHRRAQAQKRGGGLLTSFDGARAEGLYAREPVDDLSPDRLFQRRWALTVVELASGAARRIRGLRQGGNIRSTAAFSRFWRRSRQTLRRHRRHVAYPDGHLKESGFPSSRALAPTALRSGRCDAGKADAGGD